MKDGWRSYMPKAVREKFGKPCISMGNIRNPKVAEQILADGDADLIGMGRGLIAEPAWVNKVATGRECDLRKCISCNIGCAGNRIGFNRPIRCTVNPAVLEGDVYKNQKVNKNCNVVVIGGGTAGLEAACTAAEVGCNTFLLEKGETLGGLASVISKIPAKKRLADFPNYLIHRAEQLENLYIFTNTEGTPENIRKFHPNLIVSSTGSAPLLPPIRGLHDRIDKEGSKVASILGMINHINDYPEDMTGKQVVVVGGGAVNTIVNDNGHLTGHITDGIGFMSALKDNDIDVIGKKMTIVGAGGAATAIEIQAALDGVAEITIFNRKDEFWDRAVSTVEKINTKTSCHAVLYDLADLDSFIFVNATGVGMKPLEGQSVVPDKSYFRPELIVIDVPYSPLETKMRSMAKEVGCKTMNGLGMMLFQGSAAFELWTGEPMPIEHMKEILHISYDD